MSDKKPVPPSLAQFALEQLAEAGEQAAIDLTVQNVEILRAEIERRDARIFELEASVECLTELQTSMQIENDRLKARQPSGVVLPDLAVFAKRMDEELAKHDIHGYEPVIFAVAEEVARLNPCRAQAVQVNHDSDCSTNNHGVPELLGPCDCSASKDK